MCRLSPAVRAGDMVYVSGQVPVRPDGSVVDGGIEAQTRQVLENVKAALALAGATMDDVVKTTVWIEDARDFGGMNKVYATVFLKGAAGAHHSRIAADDRYQGRDRGRRLRTAEIVRRRGNAETLAHDQRIAHLHRVAGDGNEHVFAGADRPRLLRDGLLRRAGEAPGDADAVLVADGGAAQARRRPTGSTLSKAPRPGPSRAVSCSGRPMRRCATKSSTS